MMNWQTNPFGVLIAGACGLLLLIGLGLNLAWRGDVSGNPEDFDVAESNLPAPIPELEGLGPRESYENVNNRPLFSETRRPTAQAEILTDLEEEPVLEEEVADPPKVRLTGVVITPDKKVVTLTPKGGGEPVVVTEGMPLDGEFVGWSVDNVAPRTVRLRSSNGETVKVELSVHDLMIDAPPPPVNNLPPVEADAVMAEAGQDENVSRADEIRERIRQRREQLRAEAAEQSDDADSAKTEKANAYQDAIRAMIGGGNENEPEEDEDDSGDQ